LNLKIKKLKLKIEWLRLELNEILIENAKCLDKFYMDFAHCFGKSANQENDTDEEHPFEVPQKITNKLFKEIAVKTHPDKRYTEQDETFVEANKANDQNDLSTLLSIAEELDIDISEYINNEILLEHHSNELDSKIQEIKQRLPWIWYHSKDEYRNSMKKSIEQILNKNDTQSKNK